MTPRHRELRDVVEFTQQQGRKQVGMTPGALLKLLDEIDELTAAHTDADSEYAALIPLIREVSTQHALGDAAATREAIETLWQAVLSPAHTDTEGADDRVPSRLRVDGGIGATLVAGTDYRVAEVIEHHESTGIEGEPPQITTVITFVPIQAAHTDAVLRSQVLAIPLGVRPRPGLSNVASWNRYDTDDEHVLSLRVSDDEHATFDIRVPKRAAHTDADCPEMQAVIEAGIEAFRLTREYVGPDTLPAIEGWSWFDWTEQARAALADRASTPGPIPSEDPS